MTPEQLAAKACLHPRTIRALIAAKALPCQVRDGRQLVRLEDWEAFVASCPVSEWVTGREEP